MREIDGKSYISAKEYAEIKGLNVSRVSQLKNSGELPFVEFKDLGISLIDFELMELSNQEKRFAMTKYQAPAALHSYSVLDVGRYFMKTLSDLMEYKASTEIELKITVESLENTKVEKGKIEEKLLESEKNLLEKVELLQSNLELIERNKLVIDAYENQASELQQNKLGLIENNAILQKDNENKALLITSLETKISFINLENNSLKESKNLLNSRVVELENLNKNSLKNQDLLKSELEHSISEIKEFRVAIEKMKDENALLSKSNILLESQLKLNKSNADNSKFEKLLADINKNLEGLKNPKK